MSALSYICGYGYGSSDESDGELEKLNAKRAKLPAPDLSKVSVVDADTQEDNPELHGGRTRSFPHERGNWSTFVYIAYPKEESLLNLVDRLLQALSSIDKCEISEDFHTSLSKTFVLKYHQITPLSSSLQEAVTGIGSFDLSFDSIKIYCNEEKTRTFIALKVDQLSNNYLHQITNKIDDILVEFKLPVFYEDPSYHMSILWANGNKEKEFTEIIESLNNIVTEEIRNDLGTFRISSVSCKTGNKYYQYSLI